MRKKAALHNLGCKVNAYETEAMQELLENSGYEIVPFHEKADVYIVNTCTVTNMADRKSRQMLHRARKMNPDAIVAACGCYVQEKADEVADCVDLVIGNNRKKEIVRILEYMELHYSEPLSVADFAGNAGWSESRFSAIFREVCPRWPVSCHHIRYRSSPCQ